MKTVKELTESVQNTYEAPETDDSQFRVGAADALTHFGMVIGNETNAEQIQDLQNEIFDADSYEYNDSYARGYRKAWDVAYMLTHIYGPEEYYEATV